MFAEMTNCSYYKIKDFTSIGEPFNKTTLTAAHWSLPYNTSVMVTANNRSVVVRVNDRSPFLHNKAMQLSLAAAKTLDLDMTGLEVFCTISKIPDCKKNSDNTCVVNNDCCSKYCERSSTSKTGECKSPPQKSNDTTSTPK